MDSHGRVYYIDHVNRTTTWNRPRTSKTFFYRCVLTVGLALFVSMVKPRKLVAKCTKAGNNALIL